MSVVRTHKIVCPICKQDHLIVVLESEIELKVPQAKCPRTMKEYTRSETDDIAKQIMDSNNKSIQSGIGWFKKDRTP